MDNKKFEQLIDLVINEEEDKASALFHDIVVEKSREIYESMMEAEELDEAKDEDEEELDEAKDEDEESLEESAEDDEEELDEGMGGEVGGLLDEIDAEEQGMTEEDDEFADIDMDDSEEAPEGNIEDRVVELEDRLDELMAEFEEMMAGGEEDMGDKEFGGEEEMGGEENFGGEEDEQGMMEAVQLQKVSVTHGDNGQNTKSIVSGGPKVGGNGATAGNIAKGGDGGKGGTQGGVLNPAVKDIPGNYKNAPGAKFSEKGEAAPKPAKGDNGVNSKSITSESRKMVKKPVTKTVAKKIVK